MKEQKHITIPSNLEGYHYQAFADAILDQLKNHSTNEVDLSLAAKKAGLPQSINPRELAESDAFNFVLDSKGITEDFIAGCLYKDIVSKPGNRIQELKLAASMRGISEKKSVDVNEQNAQNVGKAMDMMAELLSRAKEDSDSMIIDVN